MSSEVFDKLGQPIEVGAVIAYGHALGRCAALRIGRVLAVSKRPQGCGADSDCRIKVQGIDDDWRSQKPTLCARAGTLMFSQRVICIPPSIVPDSVKQLI